MNETNALGQSHRYISENRKKASLTGIIKVVSFDKGTVILDTECGQLTIKGEELNVSRFSVEKKELEVTGLINSCVYADDKNIAKKTGGFFEHLFK